MSRPATRSRSQPPSRAGSRGSNARGPSRGGKNGGGGGKSKARSSTPQGLAAGRATTPLGSGGLYTGSSGDFGPGNTSVFNGFDTKSTLCEMLGFSAGTWIHTPLGLDAIVVGVRQGRLYVRYADSSVSSPLPFHTPGDLAAHGYRPLGPAQLILKQWQLRQLHQTHMHPPIRNIPLDQPQPPDIPQFHPHAQNAAGAGAGAGAGATAAAAAASQNSLRARTLATAAVALASVPPSPDIRSLMPPNPLNPAPNPHQNPSGWTRAKTVPIPVPPPGWSPPKTVLTAVIPPPVEPTVNPAQTQVAPHSVPQRKASQQAVIKPYRHVKLIPLEISSGAD